jgi:hypothetical protein
MSQSNNMGDNRPKYIYNTSTNKYGDGDASLGPNGTKRRSISKADYDTILASLEKSKASDGKLGAYLSSQGMDDSDIESLLAERKKKSTGSGSSVSTGYLQFPETEKLLAGDAKGNIKRTQQGIQYDIQNNEDNKAVIEKASYNSFIQFEENNKDILGDSEYDSPNQMFEILVDKDDEYLKEIEPFQNLINRVDLDIAEELGVKDAYESGMKSRGSKRKLTDSWAPFSAAAASRIKLSKEETSAIQAVNNAIKERGIPFATEYDTDDPAQKSSEIRDKYRAKYGSDFSKLFQGNFKSAIPNKYAQDEFFLKKVEDYMHMQNSSVDLNGDGRIYQRGTALSRGYNQAILSVYEMAADVAMVMSDISGNKEFQDIAKETKQQIANKIETEGKVEYNDFSLADFVQGKEGTMTGLVNKTIGLTAKSLPYMAGVAGIQKTAVKRGLAIAGSKSLAKYTASTVGMGTISAASAYANGMDKDWFEDMSFVGKIAYSGVHGLAEGAGETVSFAVFNKMVAPMFKLGKEATKKSVTEFVMGGAKSYGFQVTEEIAAESSTALLQTVSELVAKGEDITWEKLDDRVYEAIEGAILMTAGMKGATGAIRAPFEVQNLHISTKLGLGNQKLRSRAVIKELSEEYEKAKDDKSRGVIGAQLAKALQQESQRNEDNAKFFEFIRGKSPQDYARLLEIADRFQGKVDQWNSMEEGAAKSSLGAEIKSDFQSKLDIEAKYSEEAAGQTREGKFKAPEGSSKEAASIAEKIFQGEELTLEEESFYAENQAEVEQAVNSTTEAPLFTPFKAKGEKAAPTIEVTEEGDSSIIDNLINHFETISEDIFSGYKTTKENAIKGLVSIKNAVKAVRTANPEAKVFIHTTGKAFKEATGLAKLSRGYYTTGNEVHFLAPAMVSTTGYHESVHAAFMDVLGNRAYDSLFGEISKMVRNSGATGSAVGMVIQKFVDGYKSEDRTEEGVTEFIAMLADGKFDIEIEKGILRKIAEAIGGALNFEVPIPSRTQGVQIMKDIAGALKDGTPVDPEKISKLSNKKDKPREARGKAQDAAVSEDVTSLLEQDDKVYISAEPSSVSENAGKAQSFLAEGATDIISDNVVSIESIAGENVPAVVFYDNTRVGASTVSNAVDGYKTGNKFDGGFGYSFRNNIDFEYDGKQVKPIMAFTGEAEAGKLLKQIASKQGSLIPLVNQNNLTGHLGNLDTREELFGKNGHFAHVESISKKSSNDVMSALKKAVETAKGFNGKDATKAKLAQALKTINTDGIKTVADFNDFVMTSALNSFGLRNAFLSNYILLGKRGKKATKSTSPVRNLAYEYGIPTLEELSEGMTEPAFQNAELGDVVAFVRPAARPTVYTSDKKYEGVTKKDMGDFQYEVVYAPEMSEHASYPFVIGGENVGFAEKYIDVTSIFPDLKEVTKKQSYYKAGRRGYNAPSGKITAEIAGLPSTDPFNEHAVLSSTQEGKAQIIGELGASKSHKIINKLELARDMEQMGKDKEAVFLATGWYRGLDNQWRSEIRYGHVKKAFFDKVASLGKRGAKDVEFSLSDVLDSPVLYELYPNIKEDYVFVIENMRYLGYHQRVHEKKDKTNGSKIAVNAASYFEEVDGLYKVKKAMFKDLMNTIHHEVQHAVQSAEGVSDGYNEARVSGDVWYSKKRGLNTSKTQLKVVKTLFKEMMEIGEEQMLKNHRMLAYFGDALTMDGRASDAKNNLSNDNVASNSRWIGNLDPRFIEDLAKLYGKEITEENFPNELIEPVLNTRPQGRLLYGDVTAFEVIKRDNFGIAASALEMFGYTVEAAKYLVDNGGIEALKHEKKVRSSAAKHFGFFDYAFNNINIDSGDLYWNFRNRVDYLNRVSQGAAINVSRYGEKEFLGRKVKKTNFDVYRENLGEAEARLVGKRGGQKLKKRELLINELFPDVSETEIWQIPPSSFYLKINEAKKKVKVEKERLSDLKMDFDTKLTEGLSPLDIDTVEDKVKSLENTVRILGTKLQDAMSNKKGKAQLIEGTQEFDLFKKDVQEELIKAGVDGFVESNTGANRLFEHLRYKFADKYQPLQNLQKSIEKATGDVLRSDTNFRRAEALMHGKAANDARLFEENMLKPLMDKMAEYNVTNEQLSEYLYSLHAYERNEFVKNTIDPANEQGSGMSNEVADAIKSKYAEQKEIMDELAKAVHEITEQSRTIMLEFGLINLAQYDSFKMFENYIPLVGTAVTPTSDLFDFTDSRSSSDVKRGGGIALFGKEYKSVSGRFSEAQSPLEAVVSSHLRTISRARKNEVLQTLLNMVEENKDSKAWTVFTEEKPDMRVRVASKGVSVFIEEVTGEDYEYTLRRKMAGIAMAGNSDYVPVKVEGKSYYIKFNDARITKTLNDGGVGKTNMFVKALSKTSRHFTRVFTSWNPEFIFANFTRDIQTAMYNQMAEQDMQLSTISGESFIAESLKNVPKAIKGVYQFERGNREGMDAEVKKYYEEYLEEGAKTDWFFLKSAEEVEKDMLKYLDRVNPINSDASLREKARKVGKVGQQKMEGIGEFVETANTSIENGIRFGAYMAARKNGVDADKAAEFVKELTINFNRSGEMGQVANSLYLFFNASVQGSTRLMRSVVKSKKARKVAAGMMASSAMLTMFNIAMGGEDEDGIPFYNKIPEYERERFLIFMYGGEGQYAKIPLPYGVSMFFNLGTAVAELGAGVTTPMEAASYLTSSIVGSFSPISLSKSSTGFGSIIKTATPTVLKPVTELALNENFFGSPIYKEDIGFGADTPDSSKSMKGTSEWAKTLASFMNQATGGNKFEEGLVDVSPDTIEYLITFIGGGTAKFMNRTFSTISDVAGGKASDIEFNDVPLARQFLGTVRKSEAAGRYYETRTKLLKDKNKVRAARAAGKPVTQEMKNVVMLLNLEKQVQSKIKKISLLEKKVMKIEDADKRQEALDRIYDAKIKIYKQFNGQYYKMKQN